ncbi:MAG: hypothetical protein ABI425_06165 [Patescibacteria group bacterium]
MSKEVTLRTGEVIKFYPETIDSAYDLASGGMGILLYGLKAYAKGEQSELIADNVTRMNSNYIGNPYVMDWVEPGSMGSSGPTFKTPRNEAHLALLRESYDEYDRIHRAQMRIVLGGENIQGDIFAPFDDKSEFTGLLLQAVSRNLLELENGDHASRIPISDSFSDLIINLYTNGAGVTDSFLPIANMAELSDQFHAVTLQAATHKLACMLAITDQLTFDAKELGLPYARSYKPPRAPGKWEDNWLKEFGELMPQLGSFYEHAHTLVLSLSNPEDSLIAHIKELPSLPQLSDVT